MSITVTNYAFSICTAIKKGSFSAAFLVSKDHSSSFVILSDHSFAQSFFWGVRAFVLSSSSLCHSLVLQTAIGLQTQICQCHLSFLAFLLRYFYKPWCPGHFEGFDRLYCWQYYLNQILGGDDFINTKQDYRKDKTEAAMKKYSTGTIILTKHF